MTDSPPPTQPTASPRFAVFLHRLRSTLGLWILVIGVFALGYPIAYSLLIGFLAVVGTIEFHGMAKRAGVPSSKRLSIVACLAYTIALHSVLLLHPHDAAATYVVDTASFALFLALLFLFRLGAPIDGTRSILAVGIALLGFVYIAFGFNFVTRVIFLGWDGGSERPPGAWIALWLVAVTKFTDMGAYVIGSLFGKNKLIPHISPAKSWEGLGGAFLFALGAACGLYALFPTELSLLGGWRDVIILGFLLAAGAIIGDLAESFIKRSLAIKDSGQVLPGIGGVMDLIDSLCFTAPALYFYLRFIGSAP